VTFDARTRPALTAPLALPPNRVARSYRGGALLDRFRASGTSGLTDEATDRVADTAADGDRPEDWVASMLRAWTPVGKALSDEGLSVVTVSDEELTLRDLVQRRDPVAVGGNALVRVAGPTTGFVVQLLDTAQRLPVHCHPTRPFTERFLGSRWGKTEAWLVLGTRQIAGEESPRIHLGFRRDVDRQELRRWIEDQAVSALLEAMHHRTVAPGDVWLAPAGVPHTVGAGVFLAKLSEPADFTIVAETAGFPIAPEAAHLGMGWDVMVDAFHRTGQSPDELDALRQEPEPIPSEGGMQRVRLLGPDADPYFRAERITLTGRGVEQPLPWPDTFVVGIVTSGSGSVTSTGGTLRLRAGESFALPAAAATDANLQADEALEVLFCLPPDPDALAGTGWQSRDAGPPS